MKHHIIKIESLDLWLFRHHWKMERHQYGRLPYIPPLTWHHN